MKKIFKKFLIICGIIIFVFFCYLFLGKAPKAERIYWGVNFSQKQAELLGLDWKELYLQILDDLKVKNLKIIAYWDLIEKEEGRYDFSDLDFQIEEAEKRGAKIILVLGRKVPRWPECHEPDWIKDKNLEEKNQKLLKYIEEVVERYKHNEAIFAWQIENEPFFKFGECGKIRGKTLKREIKLVRKLDKRPIVVSESGSRLWWQIATYGDIVSFSLYRIAYFSEFKRYIKYPFPPVFYWRKSQIIRKIFKKDVLCGELQAEPWGAVLLNSLPEKEQEKTMSFDQFLKNIEYAKKTGIERFYFWGVEWWYLKKEKGDERFWEKAKKLFQEN